MFQTLKRIIGFTFNWEDFDEQWRDLDRDGRISTKHINEIVKELVKREIEREND